jgi:hypothetical protein
VRHLSEDTSSGHYFGKCIEVRVANLLIEGPAGQAFKKIQKKIQSAVKAAIRDMAGVEAQCKVMMGVLENYQGNERLPIQVAIDMRKRVIDVSKRMDDLGDEATDVLKNLAKKERSKAGKQLNGEFTPFDASAKKAWQACDRLVKAAEKLQKESIPQTPTFDGFSPLLKAMAIGEKALQICLDWRKKRQAKIKKV